MVSRVSIPKGSRPGSAGWWLRALVTLHFLVWVNLVPLHLATEPHLDHSAHVLAHHSLSPTGNHSHHHNDDDHAPHLATDHSYALVKSSTGIMMQFADVPPRTVLQRQDPAQLFSLISRDPTQPDGRAPPGPLGPRAPPHL